MVRMDQGRLNKRVFDGIREYKSVGGYVKQMREETEKLKITDKNCLGREQYGKKLKGIKVLVENKEKRKGTSWSKERKQNKARKINDIRVVIKGRFVKKKMCIININLTNTINIQKKNCYIIITKLI